MDNASESLNKGQPTFITDVEYFNLPTQIVTRLQRYGIKTTDDLEKIPNFNTLFSFKGIGLRAIQIIKDEYRRIFHKELFYPSYKGVKINLSDMNLITFPSKTNLQILNKDQVQKILVAKKLYDEVETLQGVAKILNLTRERVRQLLEKGEILGLFKYIDTRIKKLDTLTNVISKSELLEQIENSKTSAEICTLLRITSDEYLRLIKFYDIDTVYYRHDARKRKYINKYMAIVDFLGHHPSTTELSKVPKWRYIWVRIYKYWGSFDKFRSEYGIEKPAYNIHPNTIKAWQEQTLKRVHKKQEKIRTLIEFIELKGKIDRKMISETLGYSKVSVDNYIKELLTKNLIKKERRGLRIYYYLNNNEKVTNH